MLDLSRRSLGHQARPASAWSYAGPGGKNSSSPRTAAPAVHSSTRQNQIECCDQRSKQVIRGRCGAGIGLTVKLPSHSSLPASRNRCVCCRGNKKKVSVDSEEIAPAMSTTTKPSEVARPVPDLGVSSVPPRSRTRPHAPPRPPPAALVATSCPSDSSDSPLLFYLHKLRHSARSARRSRLS